MRLTPRRRLMIAMLATLPVGALYVTAIRALVGDLWGLQHHRGYLDCASSWQQTLYSCSDGYTSGWRVLARGLVASATVSVGCLGLLLLLIAWAMRPIRSMSEAVGRLGPTNLGERLRIEGGRRDEITSLGGQVDLLMDRVAEGYEGQRRFAANASHELRTPLAIQRTLIEVSMTAPRSPDQLELLAEQLLAANERNEALVEGLLVLAETDRGLVSRGPVRLDEVAETVLATYASLAARAQVTLKPVLEPITIEGEQVLVERLISNLVHNGVKYNHPGGSVLVEVGPDQSVSVTNTGPKVAADAVGTIFEPFRRLSGVRIDQSGGSGLGLTIARSISQAHRGTIQASAPVDGGLEVRVQFPERPMRAPATPSASDQ